MNDQREAYLQSLVEKPTTELMDLSFDCTCGEYHTVPMKHLSMDKGVVNDVGAVMKKLGIAGKGGLVFDRKIGESVVEPVRKRLADQGLDLTGYPEGEGGEHIIAEVSRAQALSEKIDQSTDYLVSVGSGVISDLTKQAANLLKIPYILIATAPSMNGYTSSMSALSEHGIKQTFQVEPARAIFADIGLLQEAPVEMARSGLGDIVSKSVCNADWKLSHLVKDTYFCSLPFRITDKTEPLYLNAAADIGERREPGIRALTDGVLRSGLSMTVIGTSTPSSGAEHLLSHYWDLKSLMEETEIRLHGVQVGVGTVMIQHLYDFMGNLPVKKKVDFKKLQALHPEKEEVGAFIDRKFGDYAGDVRSQYFQKYMTWPEKKKELERILDDWDGLWSELAPFIRPPGPVERALRESGSAYRYSDLGLSRDEAVDTLIHARLIRWRYTILDLAAELGVLEEAAQKLIS